MTERDTDPDLHLMFHEDGFRAVVSTIHLRTTVSQILALLEEQGVVVGVSERRIRQAVRTARRSKRPAQDVVVAEGRRPRSASRQRLTYRLPPGLDELPSLDSLHSVLALTQSEVQERVPELLAWVVAAGDHLASIEGTQGEVGLDVRGQSIPIPSPSQDLPVDPALTPGAGVEFGPTGAEMVACAYGYAGRHQGQLCVLEPLWIAPDMMQACFLNVPTQGPGKQPSSRDLHALLDSSGVVSGIDEEAIRQLASEPSRKSLIPIALGQPPSPASDITPGFVRELGFRHGTFRDDGSIDFRERNIFPTVSRDDVLAEGGPQLVGTPGHTIFGMDVGCSDAAIDLELIPGANVSLLGDGDRQRLVATCDGGITLSSRTRRNAQGAITGRQYHIAVHPVAHIESDVGLETGNVDFAGHVVIDGSVTSGFQVTASGGIAVAGSVEAGAQLRAGGDISVQQGIVGRETRIVSEGSLRAKFIQEARVKVDGDVAIGSYVHSAYIQCAGSVEVKGLSGSDHSGGIVGGEIWGQEGITVRNAGSARNNSTRLFAGISAADFIRLEQTQQDIERVKADVARRLQSIGLPELTADAVHDVVARHPERRDEILQTARVARELEKDLDQQIQAERALKERISLLAADTSIDVPGRAFSDVTIQIGDRQLVLAQDLTGVYFRIDPRVAILAPQEL